MTIDDIYKSKIKQATKSFMNIPDSVLDRALQYSMQKRQQNIPVSISNNYTKRTTDLTLKELTDYIMKREPICTQWGVLFKKRGEVPNPLAMMIISFMEGRDIHKGQMFQFPKGTEEFAKYYMLQILDKLDANATYGVLSNATCLLYNLNVAASITAEGRALISTAILFFESFLSNNVKFGSLDEVINFIFNVVDEKSERKFSDDGILDRDISAEECFAKIVYTIGDFRCGKIKWVPDENDLDIIWNIISNLDQEDINRLYYKNNFVAFVNNKSITKAITQILSMLKTPFLNPNKPPVEIKVELDTLQELFAEYVYYHHQIIDKVDRNVNMIKNVTAISDTDSAIVCLDGAYRLILQKIDGIPMAIKNINENTFENIEIKNGYPNAFEDIPLEEDFDFCNDRIITEYREVNAFKVLPQDGLRFSIINMLSYILGNLANDYIRRFCDNSNAYVPGEKCAMYLKNEFLFKRALLTMNKKNYASKQELQEGNIVPESESLDVKGLPIKKSTLKKSTQEALQRILYDDILNVDEIDQLRIIKDLAILDKKIYNSLASGSKDFYKPLAIKSMSAYDDPMRIQGIKASVVWNELRDENLEAIDLSQRNTIDVVKVNISPDSVEQIREKYPELYLKCQNIFKSPVCEKKTKDGVTIMPITALAIPRDVQVPEWVLEFIDYKTIINDNLCNFPLESVGISKVDSTNVNYTNILSI